MKQAENTRVRFAARAGNPFWKSAFVSIALAAAVGCGGDDGGGDTDTGDKKDSGAGKADSGTTKNDAGTTKNDAGSKADAGGTVKEDAGDDEPTGAGDAVAGKKLAVVCTACHQSNYAGAGHWPNITQDKTTGIGDWTDENIEDAVNSGLDENGDELCAEMTQYGFDTEETANLIAFLRTVPAVKKEITEQCE